MFRTGNKLFSKPVPSKPWNTGSRYYAKSKESIKINFDKPHKTYLLDKGPKSYTTTTREELLDYFRQMTLIRRVEMACDLAYQKKQIRGFLHLYNGQEAVCVGLESQLTPEDHVIMAYRCHGWLLTNRCATPAKEVMAELFGKKSGTSAGKGGSMHLYNVKKNFWGGNGIVGSQVSVGMGIAFGLKYLGTNNVCVAGMGDGAANQGQVYEAYNLSKVHKSPIIYLVENNKYAMGTPISVASATEDFYTRGHYIPGIQFDGMDVLATKEVSKFAVEYAKTEGPIILEAMTYRYTGHSKSDPGTTYRTREEVDTMRKNADPINKVKHWILSNNLATEDELKQITDAIIKEVDEAVEFANNAPWPEKKDLYTDVYVEDVPVRGVELSNSYTPNK
eukprot:TRINITY_DN3626_c0_g1_i1.p1 TRINITY_DN3626_c0_g1~~TRINITY_DN3626_c0_g1_i1.p1  ORF type:complete len:391 (+),score=106.60 TRINITY_DN3626_c0_g1_i1:67-1239(+)